MNPPYWWFLCTEMVSYVSFCSQANYEMVITTKIYIWHNSGAVMPCENICCDLVTRNWITVKQSFYWIWIASKRSSLKWVSLDVFFMINTLRPGHDAQHFADDIFKCVFLNEDIPISINISLKFVPKGLINNIPALVQIMAWCRPGDKPLSEPLMMSLLTHICITLPQRVQVNVSLLWCQATSVLCVDSNKVLFQAFLKYIWKYQWWSINGT